MKPRYFLISIVIVGLMLTSVSFAEQSGPSGPSGPNHPHDTSDVWTVPECDRILGSGALTFTVDEGITLTEYSNLHGIIYTYGLVALEEPNNLLAASMISSGTALLRSTDAGCSWHTVDVVTTDGLPILVAGPGDVVYGYSAGRTSLVRIVGDEIIPFEAPARVYGLAVDPEDALHIRIGCTYGQLYESFTGGSQFSALGGPATTESSLSYEVRFNPHDWNRALFGGRGAWRTEDGGQTWSEVGQFFDDDVNLVYRFTYSPQNPQLVWARANIATLNEGYREILVSVDGGVTFQTAVRQGEDVAVDQFGIERDAILTNQPTMAAHPVDDAIYFAWGTYYQDYGTDLFKYDLSTDELSVAHIDGLDGIDAIAFNPVDPSVMYFGLEEESISKLQVDEGAGSEARLQMNAAPNPFNPTTTISFELPQASQVKLTVYNITGRKIATLADEHMSAGSHSVMWDGSRVASGVYLYRLETEGSSITKKMVLLK